MKAEPFKFVSRLMKLSLFLRTESGEEITIELTDDVLMAMLACHEQTSYSHADENGHLVNPDVEEITCLIEGGHVIDEKSIPRD